MDTMNNQNSSKAVFKRLFTRKKIEKNLIKTKWVFKWLCPKKKNCVLFVRFMGINCSVNQPVSAGHSNKMNNDAFIVPTGLVKDFPGCFV
jgi:hypothetical protein